MSNCSCCFKCKKECVGKDRDGDGEKIAPMMYKFEISRMKQVNRIVGTDSLLTLDIDHYPTIYKRIFFAAQAGGTGSILESEIYLDEEAFRRNQNYISVNRNGNYILFKNYYSFNGGRSILHDKSVLKAKGNLFYKFEKTLGGYSIKYFNTASQFMNTGVPVEYGLMLSIQTCSGGQKRFIFPLGSLEPGPIETDIYLPIDVELNISDGEEVEVETGLFGVVNNISYTGRTVADYFEKEVLLTDGSLTSFSSVGFYAISNSNPREILDRNITSVDLSSDSYDVTPSSSEPYGASTFSLLRDYVLTNLAKGYLATTTFVRYNGLSTDTDTTVYKNAIVTSIAYTAGVAYNAPFRAFWNGQRLPRTIRANPSPFEGWWLERAAGATQADIDDFEEGGQLQNLVRVTMWNDGPTPGYMRKQVSNIFKYSLTTGLLFGPFDYLVGQNGINESYPGLMVSHDILQPNYNLMRNDFETLENLVGIIPAISSFSYNFGTSPKLTPISSNILTSYGIVIPLDSNSVESGKPVIFRKAFLNFKDIEFFLETEDDDHFYSGRCIGGARCLSRINKDKVINSDAAIICDSHNEEEGVTVPAIQTNYGIQKLTDIYSNPEFDVSGTWIEPYISSSDTVINVDHDELEYEEFRIEKRLNFLFEWVNDVDRIKSTRELTSINQVNSVVSMDIVITALPDENLNDEVLRDAENPNVASRLGGNDIFNIRETRLTDFYTPIGMVNRYLRIYLNFGNLRPFGSIDPVDPAQEELLEKLTLECEMANIRNDSWYGYVWVCNNNEDVKVEFNMTIDDDRNIVTTCTYPNVGDFTFASLEPIPKRWYQYGFSYESDFLPGFSAGRPNISFSAIGSL